MRKLVLSHVVVFSLVSSSLVLAQPASLETEDKTSADSSEPSQQPQVQPLKEVDFVKQPGRPRVLFDSEGTEIARIEVLVDQESGKRQQVLKEAATGDIISVIGDAKSPTKFLCLTAIGGIVKEAGKALLVEPFKVYANIPFGAVMHGDERDAYGQVKEYYRFVFPCVSKGEPNCNKETGSEECVFVWP